MSEELIKVPAEAKEIIKNKRTGKVYASKTDFDNVLLSKSLIIFGKVSQNLLMSLIKLVGKSL